MIIGLIGVYSNKFNDVEISIKLLIIYMSANLIGIAVFWHLGQTWSIFKLMQFGILSNWFSLISFFIILS